MVYHLQVLCSRPYYHLDPINEGRNTIARVIVGPKSTTAGKAPLCASIGLSGFNCPGLAVALSEPIRIAQGSNTTQTNDKVVLSLCFTVYGMQTDWC